jgi:uncharacterized protein (DUF433 family)
MTVEPITYIHRDERGVAWIAEANTKVIEIAIEQLAYGWDAEEIHAAHPHLSLAQIHAALSYYHDHRADLDAQMSNQLETHNRLRSQADGQLTRNELSKRLARK